MALAVAWAGGSGGTCESGAAGDVTGAQYGAGGGLTEWRLGSAGNGGGYLRLQQSYGYDGLNRLTTFGEKIDGTGAFGNRDLIGEYACGDAVYKPRSDAPFRRAK